VGSGEGVGGEKDTLPLVGSNEEYREGEGGVPPSPEDKGSDNGGER